MYLELYHIVAEFHRKPPFAGRFNSTSFHDFQGRMGAKVFRRQANGLENTKNPGHRSVPDRRPGHPFLDSPSWIRVESRIESPCRSAFHARRAFCVLKTKFFRNPSDAPNSILMTRPLLQTCTLVKKRADLEKRALREKTKWILIFRPKKAVFVKLLYTFCEGPSTRCEKTGRNFARFDVSLHEFCAIDSRRRTIA